MSINGNTRMFEKVYLEKTSSNKKMDKYNVLNFYSSNTIILKQKRDFSKGISDTWLIYEELHKSR